MGSKAPSAYLIPQLLPEVLTGSLDASAIFNKIINLSQIAEEKIIAEQILAWYGLNKKIQTVALRFGPINKVFLGTRY